MQTPLLAQPTRGFGILPVLGGPISSESLRCSHEIHGTRPNTIFVGRGGKKGGSGEGANTGVNDSGVVGRLDGAETTGERHNSSKSGVSIISIGSENVVFSVLVARGELPKHPATATEGSRLPVLRKELGIGTAVVVVSMAVIGRDSRRWRPPLANAVKGEGLIIGKE